jgi:hypothetical protein
MAPANEVVMGIYMDDQENLAISYGQIMPNTTRVERTSSTNGDSPIHLSNLLGITDGMVTFISDQFLVDFKYVIVGFKFICKNGSSRLDSIELSEWDSKTGQTNQDSKQGDVLPLYQMQRPL